MKTKVTYEFDDDYDDKTTIKACTSGPELASCLYKVKERIRSEWEECEEGGVMDKLIEDINRIIEEEIGCIDFYTC